MGHVPMIKSKETGDSSSDEEMPLRNFQLHVKFMFNALTKVMGFDQQCHEKVGFEVRMTNLAPDELAQNQIPSFLCIATLVMTV